MAWFVLPAMLLAFYLGWKTKGRQVDMAISLRKTATGVSKFLKYKRET